MMGLVLNSERNQVYFRLKILRTSFLKDLPNEINETGTKVKFYEKIKVPLIFGVRGSTNHFSSSWQMKTDLLRTELKVLFRVCSIFKFMETACFRWFLIKKVHVGSLSAEHENESDYTEGMIITCAVLDVLILFE